MRTDLKAQTRNTTMIKTFLLSMIGVLTALMLGGNARASADASLAWDKFPTEKLTDDASLQHGAKLFVNYCLTCHAAAFMRYNRMTDIGLTNEQIKNNLMFAGDKVGETMKVAFEPKSAKAWFGANPPDLSVIARSRAAGGQGSGADYLYTYLRSYYRDDSRPTGWNNLAFPLVSMPHVLWELQGERQPIFEKTLVHGHETDVFTGRWKVVKAGTLDAREYDNAVADLVAYLQWMGEPAQRTRVQLGVWVLMFLSVFSIIAWRLNAAYWKDIK